MERGLTFWWVWVILCDGVAYIQPLVHTAVPLPHATSMYIHTYFTRRLRLRNFWIKCVTFSQWAGVR